MQISLHSPLGQCSQAGTNQQQTSTLQHYRSIRHSGIRQPPFRHCASHSKTSARRATISDYNFCRCRAETFVASIAPINSVVRTAAAFEFPWGTSSFSTRLVAGAAAMLIGVAVAAHPASAAVMLSDIALPAGTASAGAAASEAGTASSSGQVPTSGVNAVLLTQQPPRGEDDAAPAILLPRKEAESATDPHAQQRTKPAVFSDQRHMASAVVLGDVAGAQQVQLPQQQDRIDATITSSEQEIEGLQVFFDITVDSEKKGRIVVQLYDDVPVGAARFADLTKGIQGVGFRRTKFDAINQDFIQDAGLRRLSFGSEKETPIAGGDGIDQLEVEMESNSSRRHSGIGDVSIVVRSGKPQETKEKLVAYRGKLVTVQENIGEMPNGTAFAITLRPARALDATNLVVGKVIEGLDVVKALAQLPTVQNNSDSGYVKTAKFLGDRRADVAIRSFGRPFAKVVVSECGHLIP